MKKKSVKKDDKTVVGGVHAHHRQLFSRSRLLIVAVVLISVLVGVLWLVNNDVLFQPAPVEPTEQQLLTETLIIEQGPSGTDELTPKDGTITTEPPAQGMYEFPRSGE